jgi:signal transduction histidine kinase
MKILVVDDTPTNIDVLLQTLEPEGCTLSVATNGEDALKLVPKIQPDLILLDIMMPGIDGFETCRRLKETSSARNIPVIFLTAKNQTEDIVKGFSMGGVDYITKPFRHQEVCARINKHLELHKLRNKLAEKNQSLLELVDAKNKLLGMASHDLRNPLTSIQGYSAFLLKKGNTLNEETRTDFTKNINTASGNMLTLVNDLLNLSVIESGQLSLNLNSGSLSNLIEERVHLYQHLAREKEIELKVTTQDTSELLFDEARIGQVLDNLLTNAIKFSPAGSVIDISSTTYNGCIRVSVKDEGPGIKNEESQKLFQPFEKLSSKATGGETGTGLGLAIAKKMIELHQGVLKVESSPGRGAKFSFELPINPSTCDP